MPCQTIKQLLNTKDLMQHFPIDVFQTGSGTNIRMNANEVIASCSQKFNEIILPNDHVNCEQVAMTRFQQLFI